MPFLRQNPSSSARSKVTDGSVLMDGLCHAEERGQAMWARSRCTGPGHAFELHRTDVAEREPFLLRSVRHRLADEHLALPRVLGDARGDVHGLAEVVALLEEDRPRVQADVGRR